MGPGNARSDSPRLLKPVPTANGYLCVNLRQDGTARVWNIHALVAAGFLGLCPSGQEACHNDGNGTNNVLSNLRWDTHSQNTTDTVWHRTHGTSKIEPWKVPDILLRHANGESTQKLANEFGVTRQAILYHLKKENK